MSSIHTPSASLAPPVVEAACRVERVEPLTHDIRRVVLTTEDDASLRFLPGQFASVAFEGLPPRDYSMANTPGDGPRLEFHIRRERGGETSAHVFEELAVGDRARVRVPMGEAYLRPEHHGPVLALGGGSGLAPMKAIVEAALALDPSRPVHLYIGARDEPDLYLLDHFAALAARRPMFRFTPVLSDPSGPTDRRIGFLHDAVAADYTAFPCTKVYLAGPPAMVEAARALLLERGVDARDLHADPFHSAAEMAARGAPGYSA